MSAMQTYELFPLLQQALQNQNQLLQLLTALVSQGVQPVHEDLVQVQASAPTPRVVQVAAAPAPNGKPKRVARPTLPQPADGQTSGNLQSRREAILEHLFRNGPMGQADVARACGFPTGSMYRLVDCPWFEKSSRGIELTTAGHQEARKRFGNVQNSEE